MGTDIKQDDLPFGDLEDQGQAVSVGEADRLDAGENSGQPLQPQARLKGVLPELPKRFPQDGRP